jgi:type I restriction enzyme, S subunit
MVALALPVVPDRPGLRPEEGDLLITRANTPDLVGDCCVVEEAERRLLLPDLIYQVRLDATQMLPKYAMHFLLSSTGRSHLESAARGTSQSMVKLRGADILNGRLPVPSVSRQAEIIRSLDAKQNATDALVSKVAALEERVRERVDALMTAAITGRVDPSSHRVSALT